TDPMLFAWQNGSLERNNLELAFYNHGWGNVNTGQLSYALSPELNKAFLSAKSYDKTVNLGTFERESAVKFDKASLGNYANRDFIDIRGVLTYKTDRGESKDFHFYDTLHLKDTGGGGDITPDYLIDIPIDTSLSASRVTRPLAYEAKTGTSRFLIQLLPD